MSNQGFFKANFSQRIEDAIFYVIFGEISRTIAFPEVMRDVCRREERSDEAICLNICDIRDCFPVFARTILSRNVVLSIYTFLYKISKNDCHHPIVRDGDSGTSVPACRIFFNISVDRTFPGCPGIPKSRW